MSSLIGNRSGNKGTCAGSCRQKYEVLDESFNKLNKFDYNLSTKDLNSLENIGRLIDLGVESFKIEGRMKSQAYVYLVVKLYRTAIDSYLKNKKIIINENDLQKLKITFNRLYTKGYLFNTINNDILNPVRPNHLGVKIGEVIDYDNRFIKIKLSEELSINDGIRIVSEKDEGFIVTSLFKNKERIKEGKRNEIISIPYNKKVNINSEVYKTLD